MHSVERRMSYEDKRAFFPQKCSTWNIPQKSPSVPRGTLHRNCPPALRTFHVEHFNSATNKFGLVKSVPRGTLVGGTGRSDMFHVEHSRASDSICRLGSHVNLPTWHMDAPIL